MPQQRAPLKQQQHLSIGMPVIVSSYENKTVTGSETTASGFTYSIGKLKSDDTSAGEKH